MSFFKKLYNFCNNPDVFKSCNVQIINPRIAERFSPRSKKLKSLLFEMAKSASISEAHINSKDNLLLSKIATTNISPNSQSENTFNQFPPEQSENSKSNESFGPNIIQSQNININTNKDKEKNETNFQSFEISNPLKNLSKQNDASSINDSVVSPPITNSRQFSLNNNISQPSNSIFDNIQPPNISQDLLHQIIPQFASQSRLQSISAQNNSETPLQKSDSSQDTQNIRLNRDKNFILPDLRFPKHITNNYDSNNTLSKKKFIIPDIPQFFANNPSSPTKNQIILEQSAHQPFQNIQNAEILQINKETVDDASQNNSTSLNHLKSTSSNEQNPFKRNFILPNIQKQILPKSSVQQPIGLIQSKENHLQQPFCLSIRDHEQQPLNIKLDKSCDPLAKSNLFLLPKIGNMSKQQCTSNQQKQAQSSVPTISFNNNNPSKKKVFPVPQILQTESNKSQQSISQSPQNLYPSQILFQSQPDNHPIFQNIQTSCRSLTMPQIDKNAASFNVSSKNGNQYPQLVIQSQSIAQPQPQIITPPQPQIITKSQSIIQPQLQQNIQPSPKIMNSTHLSIINPPQLQFITKPQSIISTKNSVTVQQIDKSNTLDSIPSQQQIPINSRNPHSSQVVIQSQSKVQSQAVNQPQIIEQPQAVSQQKRNINAELNIKS